MARLERVSFALGALRRLELGRVPLVGLTGVYCLLFSGQSVQREGMCRGLWSQPAAREILRRLTPRLGQDLEDLTTTADAETLALTGNAQRAIHAHHLGHWFAFGAHHPGVELDGAIGHSVGVVAALVAAEALSVEDSGAFVAERARAFSEVCASLPEEQGLAAVTTEDLEDVIAQLPRFPGVTLALSNAVGKGTIGGRLADLEAFARACRREGWPVRVTPLSVEGPYHTGAFAPCGPRLERFLAEIPIRPPRVPVFMGSSGRAETDPARIRELLARQPFTCERHLDAVRAAYARGCRRFLEVAQSPQPITWIGDQLVDEQGGLLPGVTTTAVTTENLEAPLETVES
jgi:[acyl-carrier-protein] S-malonyltransferase